MRMHGVEIPGELLRAQRTGALVIFAGAGVSMGPPSNLQSFRGLVNAIAAGTRETIGAGEPEERFLGRLEKAGVKVHERAAQILTDPASLASPIHFNLMRLFPTAAAVRLVTTNFDRHFDTGAAEVFDDPVQTYYEPALPLGEDFTGLVYVHGSASRRPYRLVLTDEDFGRAYLTEGWARRFLKGMFSQYTVLFVGYSHQDVVMHYLARGLPPAGTGPRYALISADDSPERWRFLGVEPIVYPMPAPHDHSALGSCIELWATLANEGALETEVRIRALAQGLPPADEEDQSYLAWAIENPEAVLYVVRYARHPEWLTWLDNRGFLDRLFAHEVLTPEQHIVAKWLSQHFIQNHSEQLFLLSVRRNGRWNPSFATEIAFRVSVDNGINDRSVISKWVSLLLQETHLSHHSLQGLLRKCMELDIQKSAVNLFLHLIEPRVELQRSIRWLESDDEAQNRSLVAAEIAFAGEHYDLSEAWIRYMRPRFMQIGEDLWPRIVAHIKQANALLRTWDRANQAGWDPMSWGRSAIEPHEQDRYPKAEDVLIDAARDLLEWKATNDPDQGRQAVAFLMSGNTPLLARIAIHGVRLSPAWTADEKIDWLIGTGLMFRFGMKHEVYLLLRDAFPNAGHGRRDAILQNIDDMNTAYPGHEPLHVDFERFNLLSWLDDACPNVPGLQDRITAIRARHRDTEFQVREYPDLDHWSTSVWGDRDQAETSEDPHTVPLDALVERIRADREHQRSEWELPAFLRRVRDAVAGDPQWGIDVARQFLAVDERGTDAWAAVIQGWRIATLSEEQWTSILELVRDPQVLANSRSSLAELLQGSLEEKQQGIPLSLWEAADDLAGEIWQVVPDDDADTEDWLQRALNHAAGNLVRFWLKLLELARGLDDEERSSELSARMKRRFEMVAAEDSSRGAVGVAMLVGQINFLFHVDEDWTRATIFPLFDWNRAPCRAVQAWDGFLAWASWTPALYLEMRPKFEQAFSRLNTDLSVRRGRFVEHVAAIAVYGSGSPLDEDWLSSFLRAGEPSDRIGFANELTHFLRELSGDQKVSLWQRWVRPYIQMRLDGVPLPLADEEIAQMLEWAVLLAPVFDEAIDLLLRSRPTQLSNSYVLYQLGNSELATTNPDAVAKMLEFVLHVPWSGFFDLENAETLLRRVIGPSTDKARLLRCCQRLGQLGSPNALDLHDLVEERYP